MSFPHAAPSAPSAPSALSGIRVLDLTQVMAGAYCSMLLADMGADVIKVERPDGGDDTRRMGGDNDPDLSHAFSAMNRNKRGITVDLKKPDGIGVLRELLADADVLVENFRPGTLEGLGLGYESLKQDFPKLIYCSISGFGSTGPYASRGGFDLVAQAMSGLMSLTGEPDRDPTKVGVPICDLSAGLFGAFGVLSAYVHRQRTGEGQFVDTSLLEAGIAFTVWETAMLCGVGNVAGPMGSAHRLSAPYEAFPTEDGWIAVGAANQRSFERLCVALGARHLSEESKFADNNARMSNRLELVEELGVRLRKQSTDKWLAILEQAGVPSGPLYNLQQVYDDPHVQSRQMLLTYDHPKLGPVQHIGPPVKLSVTPASITRSAPLLGQHTREVLAEVGLSEDRVAQLITSHVVSAAEERPFKANSNAGPNVVTVME